MFLLKNAKPGAKEELLKRCVHFYACVCAFSSDEKLTEEFEYYINLTGIDTTEYGKFSISQSLS